MEIIGTNMEEKQRKNKKIMKIIIILIVLLLIISIGLFFAIYYLKAQQFKFYTDGKIVSNSAISNDLFVYENDKVYVSLKDIAEIIDIIKEEEYLEEIIFISFSLENCIYVRELLPQQPVQWLLYGEITEERKKMLYQYNLAVDAYYKDLNKDLIEEFHANNVQVNCWTCDDAEDAQQLIAMGVDFITTNILE